MASIPEKKAVLSLSDGASVNLNKPIDIPSSATDITQITEPGWYHGKFTYKIDTSKNDVSDVKNTPAIKIKDELTANKQYNYDLFVTKTNDYIFNFSGYLFYGILSGSKDSITWKIVSPLVKDWLDSEDSESALSANCGRLLKEELDTKSDSTHVHNNLTRAEDTRDTATKPSDYKNEFKFVGIKTEKAIGISNNEKYVALFGMNSWSDSSGGGATEIAISDSGIIYIRHQSASIVGDSFGNWIKMARTNDIPSALKNPNALTIQGNGNPLVVYDGSSAKTVNISKSSVGLGSVDNTADVDKSVKSSAKLQTYHADSTTITYGDAYPLYAQWATDGSTVNLKVDNFKTKTDSASNADSASKTANAITIQTNGTTAATFDGSAAKTVNITKSSIGLGYVDNTADSAKNVKYASSAGSASSATKLQTYKQGSTTETYGNSYQAYLQWVNSSAVKLICSGYETRVDQAETVGGYKISASIADLTPGVSPLATNEIRFIYEKV